MARPVQRLLAMAADLATIGIASSLANAWLLAAAVLGLAERGRARRTGASTLRTGLAWLLVALMAVAGVREALDAPHERARPVKPALASDEAADDDDGAEDAADDATAVRLGPAPSEAASAAAAIAALNQRVLTLQTRLAQERKAARSQDWHARLRRLGLDFGIGYGWALVYFTMLPSWWRGQTVGKRLFGLRVVEITGKPMAPLLNFKRFGGYLAGMATGGLGLVQLLWDPNQQALQDKAAHTVVVDERRPRRPPPLPEPGPTPDATP
ncbi:MAG TPA: RDD family protein [Ideonella sp.]|nr:RDD family protein [Ideonella sp.]